MKEKKMRWWDKHNKKMCDDCYYGGDSQGVNKIIKSFQEDLIPMLSTGLFDKNGKEIYDGDIVIKHNTQIGNHNTPKKVHWDADGCGWNIRTPNKHSPHNYEILGNIYQNPELLN